MLKYGLKIWSGNDEWMKESASLIKAGKVDFVEVYCIPTSFHMKSFEILKGLPVVLHTPHYAHRFNIFEINDEQIRFFNEELIKTADFLNTQFIILHSDIGDSKEIFKKNIAKIYDKRILIENMPKIAPNDKFYFGYSLERLKFINQECGFDICLDFVHAVKSAISQKIDYKDFIKSLISELTPYYYHICGTGLVKEKDEHFNLFEGDFDVKWSKEVLVGLAKNRDIYLVFEMPKQENLKNDMKNINYFRNL